MTLLRYLFEMRENEERRRWGFTVYSTEYERLLYKFQGGKGHSFKTLLKKILLWQVFTLGRSFFFFVVPSTMRIMGTGVAQRCGTAFYALIFFFLSTGNSAISSRDNCLDHVPKWFLLNFDSNDTDIAHTRETSRLRISRCDCCDA